MKIVKKSAASKLSISFDNELKDLLLNDLLRFTIKNPLLMSNKQAMINSTLSIA